MIEMQEIQYPILILPFEAEADALGLHLVDSHDTSAFVEEDRFVAEAYPQVPTLEKVVDSLASKMASDVAAPIGL